MQLPSDNEDINFLRPEIAAMEQFLEWKVKRQDQYLSLLMDKYQKQVLDAVRGQAEDYCKVEGYHLCLQDYQLELGADDELFKGATDAQRWLNKPVLFAPGIAAKSNVFVRDITGDIINRVK
jgi:hypothetical protein